MGAEIKLRTNFFAVKLPKIPIFDYVVGISPQTDINRLKTRIFQLLERSSAVNPHLPYIAHDQSQRLVFLSPGLDVRVSISLHVQDLSSSSLTRKTLGLLLEICLYFASSNFCMTAFLKAGNLADKLMEFNRSSRGTMPTLPKGIVKSIRVRTLHLGYRKKLISPSSRPVPWRNTYFDCVEMGGRVSVEKYFVKSELCYAKFWWSVTNRTEFLQSCVRSKMVTSTATSWTIQDPRKEAEFGCNPQSNRDETERPPET